MLGVLVAPRVSTAHRMRAFLLTSATTGFCHPTQSRSCCIHLEMRPLRLGAASSADLAPWISMGASSYGRAW